MTTPMQRFLRYGLPVTALIFLSLAVMHVRRTETAEDVPASAPVRQPPITPFPECVAGSGIVEARNQNILVGTPVPGIVARVDVEVGQIVPSGATLFELDSRVARAALRQARASLESAEAQLQRIREAPRSEEVPLKEAVVAEANARLAEKKKELSRTEELIERNASTAEDRDQAETAVATAEAKLRLAEADLQLLKAGSWKADVRVAEAAVEIARSQLHQAQTSLDLLTVTAAAAGEVLQVNIRPGEFANSPSATPLIVLGDTTQLHVRVDFDEYDVVRFDKTAETVAMLRGHPETKFRLVFDRIEPFVIPKKNLSGDNTERIDTRVLQVIYRIQDPPDNLYVGQQLDIFSEVRSTD